MNKLIIVRHGTTDWNKKHILQGNTDIPLNEDGIHEAKELAKKLDLSKIDICISSPLIRAKTTAKIITDNKVPLIEDELLKERCFGTREGKPFNFDELNMLCDIKINYTGDNVEPIKDTFARAKKFIDKINSTYTDKTILIVSHGATIKCLHYTVKGYDENTNFSDFLPKNGEMYEYVIDK